MTTIARGFLFFAATACGGLDIFLSVTIATARETKPLRGTFLATVIIGSILFVAPFWVPAAIPNNWPRLLSVTRRTAAFMLAAMIILFALADIKDGANIFRTTVFIMASASIGVLLFPDFRMPEK